MAEMVLSGWEGLNHTQPFSAKNTAILNQTQYLLGGSVCLEAKISKRQSLAWCLLQQLDFLQTSQRAEFFSAKSFSAAYHKEILTSVFKRAKN